MFFDPENHVVKLCAEGIALEGEPERAGLYYQKAWDAAVNNEERFIAAHYVARIQPTVLEKLRWDQIALNEALSVDKEYIKAALPSLYLNLGKCYEDRSDFKAAIAHYEQGLTFSKHLNDDGYGTMVKSGLEGGLKRVASNAAICAENPSHRS
nr:tetratricopeptide repeat protein [uncultured Dyadobacter sp.]